MRITIKGEPRSRLDISRTKKVFIDFDLEDAEADGDLTLDLYPVENPAHPERHVGYWVYPSPASGSYRIAVDLTRLHEGSVSLTSGGREVPSSGCWLGPAGLLDPLLDFQIVVRRKKKIIQSLHFILTLKNEAELESFYRKDGGVYAIDSLNLAFHKRRLKVLKKLFRKYAGKEAWIADLGSGIGIFRETGTSPGQKVFCLDIEFKQRRPQGEKNVYSILGNAVSPPFKAERFDLVYSGEVLEHLLDPAAAVRSWKGLLREGGFIILTTPNLKRMLNRARGHDLPLSREHINEMGWADVAALLRRGGFRLVRSRGIYLELLLTWWRKGKVDLLQTRLNRPWAGPFMRIFMALGYFFPSLALDMIFVAQLLERSRAQRAISAWGGR